jgi:two-component system, cell cycle response regulator DivK
MSHILLVEDNQANADMIIRILSSAGYTVKHTLRGLEGAQMARSDRPGLILMDFDLPDIDGRNMILVLKKQLGGNSAPPIVAVTARTSDQEMRVAKSFGCSAFIGKPFLPEELLRVVQSLYPLPVSSQ